MRGAALPNADAPISTGPAAPSSRWHSADSRPVGGPPEPGVHVEGGVPRDDPAGSRDRGRYRATAGRSRGISAKASLRDGVAFRNDGARCWCNSALPVWCLTTRCTSESRSSGSNPVTTIGTCTARPAARTRVVPASPCRRPAAVEPCTRFMASSDRGHRWRQRSAIGSIGEVLSARGAGGAIDIALAGRGIRKLTPKNTTSCPAGRRRSSGVQRRVHDAHAAPRARTLEEVLVAARHAQHVAERAEDDVPPGDLQAWSIISSG